MTKLFFYIACLSCSSLWAQPFNGTGGMLADSATTCFAISVSGIGVISGNFGLSAVCIDIEHPLASDLEIVLRAPDGTSVPLSLRNGQTGSNYSATCFNAVALAPVAKGDAPFSGTYNPQGYLGSVNNGQDADGRWVICIKDVQSNNVGKLLSWSISFDSVPAPPLPPCYNMIAAGSSCETAAPVCSFNGFCGNTSSYNYTASSWAEMNAIFCATINNNSFISFTAKAESLTLKVFVTKSLLGGGIQLLFFEGNCGAGPLKSHGCYNQVPPGSAATLVTATDLVPGSKYFLMIDGYAGDECEYTIVAGDEKDFLSVTPQSASICRGDSISLTVSGGNGVYDWSPKSGLGTTFGETVRASPDVSTTYTVTANPTGNCILTASARVTVKPGITGDTAIAICTGSFLDLTAVYPNTGSTAAWWVAGNPVGTPSAVSSPGLYRLLSTGTTACMDTATVVLTTAPPVILGADQILTMVPGAVVDLTKRFVTTGLVAGWTVNGLPVINPAAITTPGTYVLTAVNDAGCRDTAAIRIANPSLQLPGGNQSIHTCSGNPVNLEALYGLPGFTYRWTLNGIPVDNPAAVRSAGTYQVIAFDETGYSDSAFVQVVIDARLNIGMDKTVVACQGEPVDLAKDFSTAALTTNWTMAASGLEVATVVYSAGVYRLIASAGAHCADSALVTVVVQLKPFLGADQGTTICDGTATRLTGFFDTNGLTAEWTLGENPIDPFSLFPNPADYRVIVTSEQGCRDTAVLHVTVRPRPVIATSNPLPVCAPATVDITLPAVNDGSGAGLTYTYWTDSVATLPYDAPHMATAGRYYIKGTDATGCSGTGLVVVTVYPFPAAHAGNDTSICFGTMAHLTGSIANAFIPARYLWESDGGMAVQNAKTTVAPVASTRYSLTAVVDYGTCAYTVRDTILVTVRLRVPAFAGNDTAIASGVPHQLKGTGGISYKWSPPGLLDDPFSPAPMVLLAADTRLSMIATDASGCSGSDTILIRALKGPAYYLPNAFSPNGDGLNDVFRPTTIGMASTYWFRIFNRQGRIVFESAKSSEGWNGLFKNIKQPAGNYTWMIRGKDVNGATVEMKGNLLLLR